MDRPTCDSCVHWHKRPATSLGVCSRYPECFEKFKHEHCGEHQDFPKYLESLKAKEHGTYTGKLSE